MTLETVIEDAEPSNSPLRSAVVGVLVHNEESTIEKSLQAVLSERDGHESVRSVLVVASGCTDLTEEIVRRIATVDMRVRLIVEPERSGKAAAINLLLRECSDPIIVLVGGDVVFTPGSLIRLLEPLRDPAVGMTGARPIPTNARTGIVGNAVNLLWDIHHELSLTQPKLGEAVAFRRVFQTIDSETLVDEATIEDAILSLGLQLQYVPGAVVRNHGPETLREFIAQRTRIYSGHLALASRTGYRVSSMGIRAALLAAWSLLRRGRPPHYMLTTMALEAAARSSARFARATRRSQDNGIWHPLASSKRVVANGHVLRSHHESLQTLQLRPLDSDRTRHWNWAPTSQMKRLVRVDDRVTVERRHMIITIRSDEDGARALCTRLQQLLPRLVVQIPSASLGFGAKAR